MLDVQGESYPKRRVEPMSGLMLLVTVAALAGAAWLRFGRSSASGAPVAVVGAEAPPLRLSDPETSEPVVLAGLNTKVVWVVFWSARAPSGRKCLTELETASRRLRMHRRFAMVTAAVEIDDPAAVRAAVVREAAFTLPTYLVGAETRRRFHAEVADPPLHVLIDAGGRILAMIRDNGSTSIGRMAEHARHRLDEIDPMGETRFAWRDGVPEEPRKGRQVVAGGVGPRILGDRSTSSLLRPRRPDPPAVPGGRGGEMLERSCTVPLSSRGLTPPATS